MVAGRAEPVVQDPAHDKGLGALITQCTKAFAFGGGGGI